MITHYPNNRCTSLVISLDECPWLRDTNVQLPGYIFYNYTTGEYGRDAKLAGEVKIRCYEACGNQYVVNLFYGANSDTAQITRAKEALENYFAQLYLPRSCEVDPVNGKPPVKVEECSEFF